MPDCCNNCPCYDGMEDRSCCNVLGEDMRFASYGRLGNCPLIHPLKEVSNDFYIYDTEYLFKNLDREIDLLKSAERFKEYMRNREE